MMHLVVGVGFLAHELMAVGLGFGVETGLSAAESPADPATASQRSAGEAGGTALLPDRSVVLQCSPVAAYWTGAPISEGMPPGPDLAIVNTHIRPKDARIHLDSRFVGRARYLDGKPGYLYLEPGSYLLEIHLGGYRSVLIELEASAGCRYDLMHRLERVSGSRKEKKGDPPGKGEPFHRVFGPVPDPSERSAAGSGGTDSRLRSAPRMAGDESPATPSPGGTLRFRIRPDTARVIIDGVFVATGHELHRMEGALATTAGRHRIEVTAPGFVDDSRFIDVVRGETLEVEIELSAEDTF